MAFTIFKKYPSGFGRLFCTQTCFNFSFYGLKSLFILYVIAQFSLSEKEAISLFATLMALSYGMSLVGGWIADNNLGIKKTIILGGLIQATGISVLMVPLQEFCPLALALISIGSGFYKPTLSTSVGMLFEDPKDPAKDKAYSTFYMAINLGSFAAPLLCGFISNAYASYYISLLLIVVTFVIGVLFLCRGIQFKRADDITFANDPFLSSYVFIGLVTTTLVFILYLLFKYHASFNHLMAAIALGSFVYFGRIIYQSNSQERRDILNIGLYILLFALLCSLF